MTLVGPRFRGCLIGSINLTAPSQRGLPRSCVPKPLFAEAITGPLLATASGAIERAGGSAPTSSGTSGYTDTLRLYFDGTSYYRKLWIDDGMKKAAYPSA